MYNVQRLLQNLPILWSKPWLLMIQKSYRNYTILLMLWQRHYLPQFCLPYSIFTYSIRLWLFSYFQLAARPGYLESLQRLVEIAKNPATNALFDLSVGKDENAISSRDKEVWLFFLFSIFWLSIRSEIKFLGLHMFQFSGTGHGGFWSEQGRFHFSRIGGTRPCCF